jgi:arabinoxylan arabinofuranohydrolase
MNAHTSSRLIAVLALTAFWSCASAKPNTNNAPYPLKNPVIRHMYTADAAPHVLPDGRVWMVTSVDSEAGGGYATMHKYHTFSSADLVNWTDHGPVLHVDDVRPANAAATEMWALWAPDMVYRNGKYYLYYPVRILHKDIPEGQPRRVTTWIGVAVSDHPSKRFKIINPKVEGTRGIDPAVFVDDDGQPYLYWGQHMAAKLAPNMTELEGNPVRLDVDTDRFMEAIWINKYMGRYEVSYHTKYDWKIKITADNRHDPGRKKSELAYSVGDNPLGPFKYMGTFNPEPGEGVSDGPRHPDGNFVPWRYTLSNHGGIVEYHGGEYLFYHTSALSSWRQDAFKGEGTWTQRSVCVDRLERNPDGSLKLVRQTVAGVAPVKVSQPFEIKLNAARAKVTGAAKVSGPAVILTGTSATLQFDDVDLGSGYYWFGFSYEGEATGLRAEVRLGGADGLLLGTALPRHQPAENGRSAETLLRNAKGKQPVVLVFKRDLAAGELTLTDLRIYAGAPLPVVP